MQWAHLFDLLTGRVSMLWGLSRWAGQVPSGSNSPVPEPMAPMKSAMIVRAPMHMPPKAAAAGM